MAWKCDCLSPSSSIACQYDASPMPSETPWSVPRLVVTVHHWLLYKYAECKFLQQPIVHSDCVFCALMCSPVAQLMGYFSSLDANRGCEVVIANQGLLDGHSNTATHNKDKFARRFLCLMCGAVVRCVSHCPCIKHMKKCWSLMSLPSKPFKRPVQSLRLQPRDTAKIG